MFFKVRFRNATPRKQSVLKVPHQLLFSILQTVLFSYLSSMVKISLSLPDRDKYSGASLKITFWYHFCPQSHDLMTIHIVLMT